MQTMRPVPILNMVDSFINAVPGLPQYNTNIEQSSVANEVAVEAFWVWAEFH